MKFAPRVYKLEKLHKREPYDRLHYEIHEPDGSIHPGTEAPEDGSRTLIIRYEIVPRPSSMLYIAIAVICTRLSCRTGHDRSVLLTAWGSNSYKSTVSDFDPVAPTRTRGSSCRILSL